MDRFAQLGLNLFNQGQKHFSQLHLSLEPDKLELCELHSLITAMHWFLDKTASRARVGQSCPGAGGAGEG